MMEIYGTLIAITAVLMTLTYTIEFEINDIQGNFVDS